MKKYTSVMIILPESFLRFMMRGRRAGTRRQELNFGDARYTVVL